MQFWRKFNAQKITSVFYLRNIFKKIFSLCNGTAELPIRFIFFPSMLKVEHQTVALFRLLRMAMCTN